MAVQDIKRVPVVHDGKIVGIVSRADLLKVLASGGAETADEERDHTIRRQLLAELREQKWADASEGRVVVTDGVVHFWGIIGSEVPGVMRPFSRGTGVGRAGA
jgi:CBS domain-containing protein